MAWIAASLRSGSVVNPLTGIWLPQYANVFAINLQTFALGVTIYFAMLRGWTLIRGTVAALCAASTMLLIFQTKGLNGHYAFAVGLVALLFASLCDGAITKRLGPYAKQISICSLATYPYYLLHDIVGTAILREIALIGVNRYVALLLALVLTGMLSVTVTLYPERWLRKVFSSVGAIVVLPFRNFFATDPTPLPAE
jgi:peptidoglycan/LPS O-acetylase OafA/YrhL